MKRRIQSILFLILLIPFSAVAGERVALVIGNSRYSSSALLRNPVHDAEDMRDALQSLNFDVLYKTNLSKAKLDNALDQFDRKLKKAKIAFFFYSGHGMELEKKNYIIPIDADFDSTRLSKIRSQNLLLDEVIQTMTDSHTKLNIVVLDACRDNPYSATVKGIRRRLARIEIAQGTIIAYGTSAKSQAGDGNDRNGVYTEELLKHLQTPGLNVYEILNLTGVAVINKTNNRQRPQITSDTMPPFYLAGRGGGGENIPAEDMFWAETTQKHTISEYKSYLKKYPRGKYAQRARSFIAILQGSSQAVVQTPQPPQQRQDTATSYTDPVTGMEFVLVKGGCYRMGDTFGEGDDDEKPVHKVCVDDFYMGKYEVTQGEWKRIMGSNPSRFKKGDNYPVEQVSWNDITKVFLPELNRISGKKYRLPTEAEWEYAAREGGKKVRFGNGKNIADPDEINFDSRAKYKKSYSKIGVYRETTVPVNSFSANRLGLYNMSGNVWEWCSDWYGKNYYKNSTRNNPQRAGKGSGRVIRGGGWFDDPRIVRSANRGRYTPDDQGYDLGFRLVLSVY